MIPEENLDYPEWKKNKINGEKNSVDYSPIEFFKASVILSERVFDTSRCST